MISFISTIYKKCCEKIEAYISGTTYEQFLENSMLQDALGRNIEIIGEASKNISEDFRTTNSDIAWPDIMRMRDKIVHHYFRLKLDIIWQTATENVPELRKQIEKLHTGLANEGEH